MLTTPAGHRVVVRDTSGSEAIEIEATSGAKIVLDADGVVVEFGSQKLAVSRTSISLNDGALEVALMPGYMLDAGATINCPHGGPRHRRAAGHARGARRPASAPRRRHRR